MELDKIVIIDDDKITLEILSTSLFGAYDVKTFTCPNEGLIFIEQNTPDLVLLDINMPEINGLDLCKKIKSQEHLALTNILFITSLDSQIDEEKGLLAGAVDYIHKPLCLPIIKNRIKIHMTLNLHRKLLSQLVQQQADKIQHSEEEFIRLFIKEEGQIGHQSP